MRKSLSLLNTGIVVAIFSIQPVIAQEDTLPNNFRGQITYNGNYHGEVRSRPSRMRTPSLGEALRSAGSSRSFPVNGDYNITIKFDGETVSGSTRTGRNTHGNSYRIPSLRFTGTRNGNQCNLVWSDGFRSPATCSRSTFSYDAKGTNARGEVSDILVQAHKTQFVDYAERKEARLAAASSNSASSPSGTTSHPQFANMKLEKDQAGNLLVTEDAMGVDLNTMLDAIVAIDSKSWGLNKYVVGSMTGARYLSANSSKTTFVAQGNYTYRGFLGSSGWVKLKVSNGKLDCIEFWDQEGTCRPMFKSLSQQAFVSGLAGMMSSGSSHSGGHTGQDMENALDVNRANRQERINSDRYYRQQQQQIQKRGY